MANTYRALSTRAKAVYGDSVFDAEFSPSEELDQLVSDLQIVPRPYEVLSDNYSAGKQGDVVALALSVGNEAALIAGGHIQRTDKKPTAKKRA